MPAKFELIAPCFFGCESTAKFELNRIGAENIRVDDGRLTFSGGAEMIAAANLHLRTVERVMLLLARYKASTFDELFDGVYSVPWEDLLPTDAAFPVTGSSLDSQLSSVPACQSIIKKAVVKRLMAKHHTSVLPESGTEYKIRFMLRKNVCEIMLDPTGEGLHKSGYRRNAMEVPIRETLAAGILDIARYKHFERLCDPMCGSGTIAIEAALRASNAAPGLNRSFLCESWPQLPRSLFSEARAEARAAALSRPLEIVASDIDRRAVALTRENARRAGVAQCLRVECRDVSALSLPAEGENVIVCNPPYGERMSELGEVRALCETMGKAFERQMHRRAYIITSYDDFERAYGRRADTNRKLYNGMIRTYLNQYFK